MAISDVDIKILWSRAAGLCSMPECRQKLTPDSPTMTSGAVIIGENCHIIGESVNGPRGNIPIPEHDRNKYPNIILLCRNHHRIIDSDTEAWPVERLHQIKIDHENWVQTSLQASNNDTPDIFFYKHIAELISKFLYLNSWDGVSDHAIRNMVYVPFVEGVYRVNLEVNRAHWPRTRPELETAIVNLNSRARSFIENYLKLAWRPRADDLFYQEDRTWKKVYRSDYDVYQAKSEKWASDHFRLLLNLNHAINEFADAVRTNIDPYFYMTHGKFCIHDSEGVTNMMTENWLLPKHYRD